MAEFIVGGQVLAQDPLQGHSVSAVAVVYNSIQYSVQLELTLSGSGSNKMCFFFYIHYLSLGDWYAKG